VEVVSFILSLPPFTCSLSLGHHHSFSTCPRSFFLRSFILSFLGGSRGSCHGLPADGGREMTVQYIAMIQ